MTVIRLGSGELFVHSPTPLTPSLRVETERQGKVRFIIGPNRIHYWWIPEWKSAFPEAQVYLAPRIREQAGRRIDFAGRALTATSSYPWDAELATPPNCGGRSPGCSRREAKPRRARPRCPYSLP